MKKYCIQCNNEFEKNYNSSRVYFARQKFCGQKCFGDSMLGRNTEHSEETKVKIGLGNKNNKSGLENGKKTRFTKGRISPRRGKKFPQISGENHYAWKGGISPENKKIRHSLEYRIWRRAVLERDNYTCVACGINKESGIILHADHIKPFALYPELRFAIDNGQVLCEPCHKKTPTWGWSDLYTKKKEFIF